MLVLLVVLAYQIGALPLGYWLLRRQSGQDPRLASAYNLGLENAFKLLGTQNVLLAGLLDFLKGFVAVALGFRLGLSAATVLALAVYVGHIYPP